MKKRLALILPLILATVACGPTSDPTTSVPPSNDEPSPRYDYNKVIENLLNNVNVKVTGYEKNDFGPGYEVYNTISYIDVDRDYSKIIEDDGSLTPAVRVNTGSNFQTYIKADDGGTYYEILDTDNTVKQKEYRINYNKVLFNEKFGNPFEFIDNFDIDLERNLNLTKANYIIELLTGKAVSPKKAVMSFDGNYATNIEFETHPRYDIVTIGGEEVLITTTHEINMEFSYDVAQLEHLKPGANADEHITSALSNKTNYTISFSTDLFTAATSVFVTENAIYVQNDNKSVGPTDLDMFYKKVSDNTYESYVYKASVGKFNIDELSVDVSKILPDLTTINPNILTHDSGSVYLIEEVAALNSLDNFIIPSYVIGDGYGITGTVILDENDNISQFRGSFMPASRFNVIQNYFNYGSTSIPSWLDVDNIK